MPAGVPGEVQKLKPQTGWAVPATVSKQYTTQISFLELFDSLPEKTISIPHLILNPDPSLCLQPHLLSYSTASVLDYQIQQRQVKIVQRPLNPCKTW